MPAFAPAERRELVDAAIGVEDEMLEPAVLLAVLVAVPDWLDEAALELLEVVDADEEDEVLEGADVDIVAPEDPSVKTSVFWET